MNIKENIYYIVRNYVKKYLTGNLGEVVETEDKLICYVGYNKSKKVNGTETFLCYDMINQNKELAELYKLNKPVYYIFNDLEFLKPINIFGYNCNVYIKDCEFSKGLHVRVVGGKCSIEATDIKELNNLMLSAHELVLQDLYLNNEYWYLTDLNLHISANDLLKVDGCIIGSKNRRLNIWRSGHFLPLQRRNADCHHYCQ